LVVACILSLPVFVVACFRRCLFSSLPVSFHTVSSSTPLLLEVVILNAVKDPRICRCLFRRCLFSVVACFTDVGRRLFYVVILTLSVVEWGRIPVFIPPPGTAATRCNVRLESLHLLRSSKKP
jgi:hypothetical protein